MTLFRLSSNREVKRIRLSLHTMFSVQHPPTHVSSTMGVFPLDAPPSSRVPHSSVPLTFPSYSHVRLVIAGSDRAPWRLKLPYCLLLLLLRDASDGQGRRLWPRNPLTGGHSRIFSSGGALDGRGRCPWLDLAHRWALLWKMPSLQCHKARLA